MDVLIQFKLHVLYGISVQTRYKKQRNNTKLIFGIENQIYVYYLYRGRRTKCYEIVDAVANKWLMIIALMFWKTSVCYIVYKPTRTYRFT